jgi:uncharacterized delta-60 repeat protein
MTGALRCAGVAVVTLLLIPPAAVEASFDSLDPTFGTGGIATTPIAASAGPDFGFAVALQADGKFAVAGRSGGPLTVESIPDFSTGGAFSAARYNANGSLDTSFDGDGKVTTEVVAGKMDQAHAVGVQADGKIVAAGFAVPASGGDQFALVRYNLDGSLDTSTDSTPGDSFDGDGKVTTSFTFGARGRALAIRPDGKIVVAGESGGEFALARYNTDGSPDTTFSEDGKLTIEIRAGGFPDVAYAVAVQGDGKIVAAGSAHAHAGSEDFALVRFNADGSLDDGGASDATPGDSFDGDGVVTTPISTDPNFHIDEARALVVQPDGKLVAGGWSLMPQTSFSLARYNPDGSLDTTFDGDGKVTTGGARADALALRADGKLVAAGSSGQNFALARYNTNGSLDTSFDADGKTFTRVAPGDQTDIGRAVAVQPDGKAVAAGYADMGPSTHFDIDYALVRYLPDGDTTPPAPPALTGTDPASPSNDEAPRVTGSVEPRATVKLYPTSNCSGSPAGEGSAADFSSTGVEATVPPNSTTTFRATATDEAGHVSGCSTSSITYVEDSAAPASPTQISTDPASPANDTSPFVKGTAEAGSTVRLYTVPLCTGAPVAEGTAAEFASPGLQVSVADNSSTTFRATATDPAGNASPCFSTITYVEDSTAPETTIDYGPTDPTMDPRPSFGFSSNEFGGTFECSLDSGSFAACTPPYTPPPLTAGRHTFEVRATDRAGNTDPTPDSRSFTINTSAPGGGGTFQPGGGGPLPGPGPSAPGGGSVPPDGFIELEMSAPGSQSALGQRGVVLFVECPEVSCTADAGGYVNVPSAGGASAAKRYTLRHVTRTLSPGERARIKLGFSRTLLGRIRRALRNPRTRRRVKASVSVTVTDAVGNRETERRTIRLRR